MTLVTVSSNEPACTNLTILNDNILEGCEAFFVAFEVVPNFSGVAAIPRDADKAIVVIIDDLMDGKYLQTYFRKLNPRIINFGTPVYKDTHTE